MGKTYVFTSDVEQMLKDRFIEEVRTALQEYEPDKQIAQAVISAIGGMMILLDKAIEDLHHKEDEEG